MRNTTRRRRTILELALLCVALAGWPLLGATQAAAQGVTVFNATCRPIPAQL